mmetsp:Transcript_70893/g.184036  ORF Transcript_70893/g.184036 Transcript_70893/m.184036 type:complete len:227 (-) Transcript_70893:723-1403(-)
MALWRTVPVLPHCTQVAEWHAARRSALHSHAKVHQPHNSCLEEDVLQGQVTVPDALSMKIRRGLQDLPCVLLALPLLKPPSPRNLVEQLAALGELCDQPDVAQAFREDAPQPQEVERQIGLLCQVLQHADLGQGVLLTRRPQTAQPEVHLALISLRAPKPLESFPLQPFHRYLLGLVTQRRPLVPEDVAVDARADLADYRELTLSQRTKAGQICSEVAQVRHRGID